MPLNLKRLLARGPENIQAERVFIRDIPMAELGFTVLYILIAGLWCVFSDEFFDNVMDRPAHSAALETVKWINFVLTTSLVLYLVLRRNFRNRRLAEEALRLSQQRFEYVALATTDAIWDLNLETSVIWWSEGIHQLFGYRLEDVSSKIDWWLERLHPDDRDRVTTAIKQVGESGGRTWVGHYRFRRSDGSYAVVMDHGYFIRDASGKPVRVVGGITDITERRRAEETIENSRRQLRALSARLQSSREEERTTVAREIHDELGQLLTAIKINLDWLERKLGERENDPSLNPLLERVIENQEMAHSAILTVQRISSALRPGSLDHLGLAEALQQEIERFEQRTKISCRLDLPQEKLDLARDGATAVFRIFQEALTNVARHAQATQVNARLQVNQEQVSLEIEDNGCGIAPEALANPRSLGLLGMRERAVVLGGEVAVTPVSPQGTRVSLRLPRQATDTKFWSDL